MRKEDAWFGIERLGQLGQLTVCLSYIRQKAQPLQPTTRAAASAPTQAVPIEGAIESLHSAGQYLVLAASDLGSLTEGLNGSLIVLDFAGGAGFGCSAEPAMRGRARPGTGSSGSARQRQGRQPKQQEEQQEPGGKRKKQQEEGKQRRQRKGKGRAAAGPAARRGSKAAAAEEEPGPSRKRSRR